MKRREYTPGELLLGTTPDHARAEGAPPRRPTFLGAPRGRELVIHWIELGKKETDDGRPDSAVELVPPSQ